MEIENTIEGAVFIKTWLPSKGFKCFVCNTCNVNVKLLCCLINATLQKPQLNHNEWPFNVNNVNNR